MVSIDGCVLLLNVGIDCLSAGVFARRQPDLMSHVCGIGCLKLDISMLHTIYAGISKASLKLQVDRKHFDSLS